MITIADARSGTAASAPIGPGAGVLPAAVMGAALDGRALASYPSKQVAKRLGMLPQSPIVPAGVVVEELVARGRFAHQGLLR